MPLPLSVLPEVSFSNGRLFNGISLGAGVVIARYFGAREKEKVQDAIHTTVAFGIVAGILLTAIGLIMTPTFLRWMGTPADVLKNSVLYFRIYFLGSIAFVLYNILLESFSLSVTADIL